MDAARTTRLLRFPLHDQMRLVAAMVVLALVAGYRIDSARAQVVCVNITVSLPNCGTVVDWQVPQSLNQTDADLLASPTIRSSQCCPLWQTTAWACRQVFPRCLPDRYANGSTTAGFAGICRTNCLQSDRWEDGICRRCPIATECARAEYSDDPILCQAVSVLPDDDDTVKYILIALLVMVMLVLIYSYVRSSYRANMSMESILEEERKAADKQAARDAKNRGTVDGQLIEDAEMSNTFINKSRNGAEQARQEALEKKAADKAEQEAAGATYATGAEDEQDQVRRLA